jgi:hypothetical protein
MVTHTINSDVRFDSYGILKSGQGAENFLDRLVKQANGQVSEHKMRETFWGVNTDFEGHLLSFPTPTYTHVSDTHNHGYGHFSTAMCGVCGLLEFDFTNGLNLLAWLRTPARL